MTDHPSYVNVADAVESATGVPLAHYEALGMALFVYFYQHQSLDDPVLWIAPEGIMLPVEPEIIEAFLQSWSEEREWFRDRFDEASLSWDFKAFRQRPLLHDGGRYIALSLDFLVDKTTDGVFHLVYEHLTATDPSKAERWREYFGGLWEEAYVRLLLEESIGDPSRILHEHDLRSSWPEDKKIADSLVIYPEECVIVEAVARSMTLRTAATGGPEDLDDDLAKAVLRKARQIASTVEVLTTHPEQLETPLPKRFVPVIALPGPFPYIPGVADRVRQLVRDDAECSPLLGSKVAPLAVLDADDLELWLGTGQHLGRTLTELLDEWARSALADMSFALWAANRYRTDVRPPAVVSDRSKTYTDRALNTLENDGGDTQGRTG